MVYTTLSIPAVMLLEAFLSFLGLGVQPPMSSWGLLIKEGAEQMEEAPWLLRSEEHTSELQSRQYLVCRLLLDKKNDRILDLLIVRPVAMVDLAQMLLPT